MGLRAPLLRHRLGRRGERHPAIHPRLLPPRVRPVHRDHHPQPEAGHEEEPQGSPAPREVPRGAVQDLLPAGLPQPAREVRAGVARLRAPRGAARAAARWPRPHEQRGKWGDVPPPGRNARTSQPSRFVSLRSPLHEHHRALGGRLVDFAGWDMPLQFSGVVAEHTAVRERVGLFDVSHLGKLLVEGAGAIEALEWAVTNGVGGIPEWRARYNLVLTDGGGIVDDLFVYRRPDAWLVVPNAANAEAVLEAIQSVAGPGTSVTDARERWAILALQGRASRKVADAVLPGATDLPLHAFGDFDLKVGVGSVRVQVARTGYTGEYGFELFVPSEDAPGV